VCLDCNAESALGSQHKWARADTHMSVCTLAVHALSARNASGAREFDSKKLADRQHTALLHYHYTQAHTHACRSAPEERGNVALVAVADGELVGLEQREGIIVEPNSVRKVLQNVLVCNVLGLLLRRSVFPNLHNITYVHARTHAHHTHVRRRWSDPTRRFLQQVTFAGFVKLFRYNKKH